MTALVGKVTAVVPHPESDKLDIVTIGGKTNVANRPAPEQPRYKVGDYAIILEENLILPDDLIKHLHMWDHDKNKGGLAGGKGNRTKGRKVGGILSEVALCAVDWDEETKTLTIPIENVAIYTMKLGTPVEEFDASDLLGIKDYVPQN